MRLLSEGMHYKDVGGFAPWLSFIQIATFPFEAFYPGLFIRFGGFGGFVLGILTGAAVLGDEAHHHVVVAVLHDRARGLGPVLEPFPHLCRGRFPLLQIFKNFKKL
jgi:hypothetical protein